MSYPVCPCDGDLPALPFNLPELSYIAYRVGNYVSFRQAVLTPLFTPATPMPLPVEQTLSVNGIPVWTTDGAGDLAVMVAEWFAYIADIIAFYNERIANQDYLRTASLPESVNNLIALLGYRPRPAIGAYGNISALLSTGPSFGNAPILLPQGLQFQSKPSPGQTPQTFELQAATPLGTPISGPDKYPVAPAPVLLDQGKNLLLQGAAGNLAPGDFLLVTALDGTSGGPWLAKLQETSPVASGAQTLLKFKLGHCRAARRPGCSQPQQTRAEQRSLDPGRFPSHQRRIRNHRPRGAGAGDQSGRLAGGLIRRRQRIWCR